MLRDHNNESGPLAVRVEGDGTGSASFAWPVVLDVLAGGLALAVGGTLADDVAAIGLRFLDADGRATDGPVPGGITLIGFTTNP